MNYFQIINKCLSELNYKQVTQWGELVKTDHIRLKEMINRVNCEVCLYSDWNFLERLKGISVEADGDRIPLNVNGRLANIIMGAEKYDYSEDYMKFLLKIYPPKKFSIFANKIWIKPEKEDRMAVLVYYTNDFAKNVSGEDVRMLENPTDESIIPQEFAEPLLVYGSCLKMKANPQHHKFNYWHKMYIDALSEMRSKNLSVINVSPSFNIELREHNLK